MPLGALEAKIKRWIDAGGAPPGGSPPTSSTSPAAIPPPVQAN
jgi:hypothetical protein